MDNKYFVIIQDHNWYEWAYLCEGEDRDHPLGHQGKSLEGLEFPKSLGVVADLNLVQDLLLTNVEGLKKACMMLQGSCFTSKSTRES